MPTAPPPPGRLTSATGTGTSFSSVMTLWITRAIRSAPPPTANGITNSTSRLGFQSVCAMHCEEDAARAAAQSRARRDKRIPSSHSVVFFEDHRPGGGGVNGRSRESGYGTALWMPGDDIEQVGFVAHPGDARDRAHALDLHDPHDAA